MGLLSDGRVHSSIEHLFALIDAAVAAGVPIAIHAFLRRARHAAALARRPTSTRSRRNSPQPAAPARSPASAGATTRWIATSAGSASRERTHAGRRGETRLALRDRRRSGCAPRTRAAKTTSSSLPTLVGEPRPVARRRRGDLLQLPSRSRAPADAGVFDDRTSRSFRSTRFRDFIFATMTQVRGEFPQPGALRTASAVAARSARSSRAAGLTQLRLGRNRKVRARHVLFQRRARGRVPRRRSRADPFGSHGRDLRSGSGRCAPQRDHRRRRRRRRASARTTSSS